MAHRRSKLRKEVKELSLKELQVKERELVDHIFQIRMQWKTGQLASTAMMGLARKELARVKTFISKKQKAPATVAKA